MHRPVALSLLSGAGLLVPTAAWAGGTSHPAHPPLSPLFLDRMTVTAYTLGEDPIPGFIPQVIMGVTNEQDSDTSGSGVEGFGIASSTPGGSSLPIGGSPLYVVATLDSGSQSHIISYNDSIPPGFDIQGAGLEGAGSSTIVGISGSETVSITDALGVYATDLSNGSVSNNAINVTPGTLVGHYNVPVLTGNQGDGLPNVVGSPILAQYRVTIQNSQPRHLTVGGTTYKSPRIGFSSFPSTGGVPTNYSKLTLSALDPIFGGAETQPTPYYINFASNGPNDPDTPGAWASLETNGGVGLSRSGQTFGNQSFLLDTGAQLSVISNDTASQVGIFNASPANADFTVDVQGVGGITTVPGYYLDSLNLTTQGGVITWKHVPVLVVDLPNPDGSSTPLPGLLGTNLFSDRDLVLNTDVSHTGQTFIAIGPQLAWTTKGGGTWSTASNWANMPAAPNGIDMQANFYDSIT
ncbi:MAG TPA: aspartyl protease family protein, partial [Tepidisphaeraceae bacterium]|nr:aspartyl protease family protein [Tepidisphaeraceae bacterium]